MPHAPSAPAHKLAQDRASPASAWLFSSRANVNTHEFCGRTLWCVRVCWWWCSARRCVSPCHKHRCRVKRQVSRQSLGFVSAAAPLRSCPAPSRQCAILVAPVSKGTTPIENKSAEEMLNELLPSGTSVRGARGAGCRTPARSLRQPLSGRPP